MMNRKNKHIPGSNMLREGSRIILPEQRQALMEHQVSIRKRERPILDEQELQHISVAIQQSFIDRTPITIYTYSEFEDIPHTGVVERIEQQTKRIRIGNNDYIYFSDIVRVTAP
ncbi:YolD-like family protein [Thermobacillus composti]|jgi:hypothetical protein|nr:YolD-like family protein [Thermobacillus composti]